VDSGTTLVIGPKRQVDAMFSDLCNNLKECDGSTVTERSKNFLAALLSCPKDLHMLPNIEFMFGNKSMVLSPINYIMVAKASDLSKVFPVSFSAYIREINIPECRTTSIQDSLSMTLNRENQGKSLAEFYQGSGQLVSRFSQKKLLKSQTPERREAFFTLFYPIQTHCLMVYIIRHGSLGCLL